MSEHDDAEMKLPTGKACGDCVHAYRCEIFGFTPDRQQTMCSFAPSRFRLAQPTNSQQKVYP